MSFSFFSKCKGCGKNKFFIKQRVYKPSGPPNVPLTSDNELCGRCFKNIKKLLSNDPGTN